MSFDLQKILESKRALRQNLAARPVAEKLRMLDAMRERELAIRKNATQSDSTNLREEPASYPFGKLSDVIVTKSETIRKSDRTKTN